MSESKYRQVPLRDLATDIKDGSHGTHPRVTEGIPLLSAKNISENGRLVLGDHEDQIDEFEYGIINSAFAPKADDLLVTIVGSIGRRALFNGSRVAFQRSVAFVRPSKAILPQYLFHAAGDSAFTRQLHRRSNVTAQAGLYLGELAKIRIPLPDEPTQCRIAEILTTVDEAMEQTEALVGKLEQMKAGLMHDLFTRGVTPDGRLRPTRQQAPHLYHETPLGWLPKEWAVKPCSEICLAVIDCKNRTPPVTDDGHPVIRTPNVRNGEFAWSDLAHTDPASYVIWTARGRPQSGDIVITREAPVGEVCMIPDDVVAPCLGQRMMLYRPDPERVNGHYMLHAIQSQRVQKHLDVISGGSTVGHVKVGDIRNLRLPLPLVDEQLLIVKPVEAARAELRTLREDLAKLRQQKQGLMQDLLTGRVPVNA